ncbi:MAG: endonuclease MutS2 [Eubacteriales bacterium]
MLFNQKSLTTLGYDKIIDRLTDCAMTGGAKQRARTLLPSDDYQTVLRRQQNTTDARRLIGVKGYPPFYAEEEVPASVERAEKGAVLSPLELLRVAALLRSARALLDYIRTDKLFDTVLDEIFLSLLPNRPLEERIGRCILSEDMIADEASPALADIRRKIRAQHNRIKDALQSYVGGERNKYLQENLVTLRDGRYVVPVKAEYRNEVKGIVHDMSASGATVFIEPMAVVDANNELRRLQAAETHEIERIMAELSAMAADFSYEIKQNFHHITELSFAYACASLAEEMKAAPPAVLREAKLHLHRARHPLIDPKTVVPIDISLGKDYHTLIITGPNTGGKTVTLKTLGLLTLMTQAGLHIPAGEGSEVGVFSHVLADIGDEQSIEQSLSTFSSHMVNIVEILRSLTPRSLVLFDELGAGTDPVEGAALAIAILETVRASGALSASTTHYAELKMFALETEGVENAGCEFDVDSLKPTYKLIIGIPGKSNAFAISEKLGLSPDIVRRANERLSGESRRFERIVEQLNADRAEMEKNREESARLRREHEDWKRTAEQQLKERIREAEEEIKRNREKTRQLLDSTRAACEYVLKQLDDLRKKQGSERFEQDLAAARRELRTHLQQAEGKYDATAHKEVSLRENDPPPTTLQVGDRVYLLPYAQVGEVVEAPDKNGQVQVRAGVLRAKLPLAELRLLDERQVRPQPKPRVSEGKVKTQLHSPAKSEIDVRGQYTDDAWQAIDKYLDEAVLAGFESARIIHGKGTGALRKYIQQCLKTDPRVKGYRNGAYGEGDLGVTVVTLR